MTLLARLLSSAAGAYNLLVATESVVADALEPASVLRGLPVQLESHVGFSEVLESLARGESGTLGGVWGSSRALVAASLARRCPATLVVVLPHANEVDALCDDLKLFTEADS